MKECVSGKYKYSVHNNRQQTKAKPKPYLLACYMRALLHNYLFSAENFGSDPWLRRASTWVFKTSGTRLHRRQRAAESQRLVVGLSSLGFPKHHGYPPALPKLRNQGRIRNIFLSKVIYSQPNAPDFLQQELCLIFTQRPAKIENTDTKWKQLELPGMGLGNEARRCLVSSLNSWGSSQQIGLRTAPRTGFILQHFTYVCVSGFASKKLDYLLWRQNARPSQGLPIAGLVS